MQFINSVWLRLRRRRKAVMCGVVFASIVWFALSHKMARFRKEMNALRVFPCSGGESREIIAKVCSLYKKEAIVGDLCEPLCNQQLVKFVGCLNYRHGKYVGQVECRDFCKPHETVTAVLKMKLGEALEPEDLINKTDKELLAKLHLKDEIGVMNLSDYIITIDSLSSLVRELLDVEYGFMPKKDQDVLRLFWNGGYNDYFKEMRTNLLFARSFWSVVRQKEYRISKVFSDWDVFPNIYGSCGSMYLVENAPDLKTLNKMFPVIDADYQDWRSRAKTAIAILNLVMQMDTMEHPLHLCDIKSPHFGIMPNNNVRFIDADTVLANQALMRTLGSLNCTLHKDCAFFDCEGWCQQDTGKCSPIRTNNNLQVVCAKVFRYGLLSSPPLGFEEIITRLLDSCADDITEITQEKIEMKKPDDGVLTTLSFHLSDSLNDIIPE